MIKLKTPGDNQAGECMIYQSPVGDILVKATDKALTQLYFLTEAERPDMVLRDIESSILDKASTQLDEYFAGNRRDLSIPLHFGGTPFMQEAWEALRTIPYGQTRAYGEIAASIARPKAARAVGMACNRNPISLFIPCHRVVGSNGNLVGFRGGTHIKEKLLALEAEGEK
jgi:methylated-DNA-[protein]-cysteine S-methyltransferase